MHRPAISSALVAVGSVLAATATLLLPALWNKAPFYYWDSVDYIYLPFSWDLPVYRTVGYGVFAGIGRLAGTIWAVILVQTVLTVYVIRETLAVFAPLHPDRLLVPLALVLTALTGLPWAAGQLMPDALTGLIVLGLATLAFGGNRPWWTRWPLAAATLVAVSVHSSHILLGIGLVSVLAVLMLAGRLMRSELRLRMALPAMTIVAAMTLVIALHWVTQGRPQLVQSPSVLLLARLVQDKIAKRFLDDHCKGEGPYMLCRYRDRLPTTANAFLWERDSIVEQLGGWTRLEQEAELIFERSLFVYPGAHLLAALQLTGEQLVRLRTGDGISNELAWLITDTLKQYYPRDFEAFTASRQAVGIDFEPLNTFQVPLALGITLVMLLAMPLAWRRRDLRMAGLTTTVALSLIGNALICGVLSNPSDRYQNRLIWLSFVVVSIAACPVALAVAQSRTRRRRTSRMAAFGEYSGSGDGVD